MSLGSAYAIPEPQDKRQAWWGVRYVQAVAAQAGFAFVEPGSENDVHSLDGQVMLRSGLGVSVQVKCASASITRQKSYVIKPGWRTNWEALILPAYFVVVSVPSDTTAWMVHGEKPWSTLLQCAAFWTRIDPLDPSQTSITVQTKQRLTVDTFDEWAADLQQSVTGGLMGGGL